MSRRVPTLFTFRLVGCRSPLEQDGTDEDPRYPAGRRTKVRLAIIVTFLLANIFTACQEPNSSGDSSYGCREPNSAGNSSYEWTLSGLEEETIHAIAADPTDGNIIYVGSISNFSAGTVGGLFKSIDGGAVWDTVIRGITVLDIDIHPCATQTVYITGGINLLTGPGILKTTDGGETWARADSGIHITWEEGPIVLAIDPVHPETLYVGTGGPFGGNIYKSTNGGQTWQSIGDNLLDLAGVTAIAIDPNNTSVVYAGTADIGAISRSTNGGGRWERLDFPEVGIVYDLLVDPINSGTIYAGTWRHGFYLSTDGGDSWQEENVGFEDTVYVVKIGLLSDGELILAVFNQRKGAAYRSKLDNIEWSIVDTLIFWEGINTLFISDNDQVAVGARGIYLLSLEQ